MQALFPDHIPTLIQTLIQPPFPDHIPALIQTPIQAPMPDPIQALIQAPMPELLMRVDPVFEGMKWESQKF